MPALGARQNVGFGVRSREVLFDPEVEKGTVRSGNDEGTTAQRKKKMIV
jgi:hypothetical protein